MTLGREAQDLLTRVREASDPDDAQLNRVRAALLAQLPPGYVDAAPQAAVSPASASPSTGRLALGHWKLGGLLSSALVLGGVTGAVLQKRPEKAPSVERISAPRDLMTEEPVRQPPTSEEQKLAVEPLRPKAAVVRRPKKPEVTATRASDLDAQVQLLAQAIGALRSADRREARRLLELHTSLYPDSPLVPERETAFERLMAAERAEETPTSP